MKTIKSYKDLQSADLEKMAAAVEVDAGHAIPGLRESLNELNKDSQVREYIKSGRSTPPKPSQP